MSAAWMKLATILLLSCSGLCDPGSREVLWRKFGEAVTIQCRSSESHLKHLDLKKGFYKDVSVLQKSNQSNETDIGPKFTGRVQENGAFPNIDVLIRNLTSDDTGPYWCMYRQSKESEGKQGNGSMLVVVKGDGCTPTWCNTSSDTVLLSVVISTAVFLSILMCGLMWLIKTTTTHQSEAVTYAAVKPSPDPNCVYEEMGAMLRSPPASSHPT